MYVAHGGFRIEMFLPRHLARHSWQVSSKSLGKVQPNILQKKAAISIETEYELTTDYPVQEQSLRNRLEEMPVTEGGGKGSTPFRTNSISQ